MKKNYIPFQVEILKIEDDIVRTSDAFTPEDAPDVYEPDPFTEN